jgi:hypothetical protein
VQILEQLKETSHQFSRIPAGAFPDVDSQKVSLKQ